MSMTRQQITVMCKNTMGEFGGTEAGNDPFAWDRLISTAADDVARATDCYAAVVSAGTTAGLANYCLSEIYKITGVYWTNATGQKVKLEERSPSDYDAVRPRWRNDPAGDPRVFLPMGLNEFWLNPTPSVTAAGALAIEGFGVPGETWALQSAVCPLPERAGMCVMYRACLLRCIQKPTPENAVRRSMLQQEYAQAKGKLAREVIELSQATRVADQSRPWGNF